MKKTLKFLTAFVLIFILVNCEVKIEPKTASAQKRDVVKFDMKNGYTFDLLYKTQIVDGITYHIYWGAGSDGYIQVINHTKEKLEVAKLKLEIEKLK